MRGACTFLHLRKMQQDKAEENVNEFRTRVPWRQFPWALDHSSHKEFRFNEEEEYRIKKMEEFLTDPTCPIHPECRARLLNNLRAVVYDDFSNAKKFVEDLETDLYVLTKQREPLPHNIVEVSEARQDYKEESLRKMEAIFFPELIPKEERDQRMLLHVRQKEKLLKGLLAILDEEEKLLRQQCLRAVKGNIETIMEENDILLND